MFVRAAVAVLFGVSFIHLDAQQPGLPPVRPLGPIIATATDSLKSIGSIRQLSDGRLLVNDQEARRVLLFDARLAHSRTIIDTSTTATRRYTALSYMRPYLGDSTLFIDPHALAIMVIGPSGTIARVIAPPTVATQSAAAYSSVDSRGRLIYEGYDLVIHPALSDTSSASRIPRPDSAALLRADLQTGRVDTVAFVALPNEYLSRKTTDADGFTWPAMQTIDPMPVQDDWAVVSDGTAAVLRTRDFHVDWYGLDGRQTSSPKLPHEWHRVSDSAKTALIDSLRQVFATQLHRQLGRNADGATKTRMSPFNLPDPSTLPDYESPFLSKVRADADDNLWIRENDLWKPKGGTDSPSGKVYDVVNRAGVMIDRIEIPGGTSIEGFGPGLVYLSERVAGGLTLARARIR